MFAKAFTNYSRVQNILIRSTEPCSLYFCNLGLARDFKTGYEPDVERNDVRMNKHGSGCTIGGTEVYSAPELFGPIKPNEPIALERFQKADMWAIGECIFEFLTGFNTFNNRGGDFPGSGS